MTQIYELDKAMGVFEAVNPELFKGYKTQVAEYWQDKKSLFGVNRLGLGL